MKGNIYDYLKESGEFTYFVRLIDDLNYKDVLQKTGSKTLFPAKDDAFERFFETNTVGVRNYEMLSPAMKRMIMNSSMINMAYLSTMLSNLTMSTTGTSEGQALRQRSTSTYLDSISFIKDERLLENSYWNRFSKKGGLYLVDDESPTPLVYFTPQHMAVQGITNEDFSILNNREKDYQPGDIYVNGIRIIQKDIICKNGYIHVLEEVLLPGKNMSQIIRDNGQTSLFNRLLNKFCAPYYEEGINKSVRDFYDGSPNAAVLPNSDSIFVKRYFTETNTLDPLENGMANYGLLYYDPSNNMYASATDMGAMFIPTDEAMEEYIESDKGRYLKEAYGSWENIPTPILALFLKNHQKKSFMSSLPHAWPTLTDESSFRMDISTDNVNKTYLGCNGAVYISNKVFPPIDYQCVYGPTLTSDHAQVMNWAIHESSMRFFLYLRSMENMYNLLVPTDEALQNYRDPISWARGISNREIWAFRYVPADNTVAADVYRADANGNKGAFLRTEKMVPDPDDPNKGSGPVMNRLIDILDMHIVVGEKNDNVMLGYIDDGRTNYAMTKGGTMLKVSGEGKNLRVQGAGDMEANVEPASIITNEVTGLPSRYDSDNGRTFFIDRVLQDPIKSVYTVLGEHEEYKAFFDLLKGDDRVFNLLGKEITPIFDMKMTSGSAGLGFVVNSFNNFRYTVFVPTKEALDRAFEEDPNLYTWDEIFEEEDMDEKKKKANYLLNFLKYHLMDNLVLVDEMHPVTNMNYETAARNLNGKFYKLTLNSRSGGLEIQCQATSNGQPLKAKVITNSEGTYNLMARDYIVDNNNINLATSIVASSRAVIHLIDTALRFE
ncbi:fasciclin domain-containing protein [Bacteroides sp.]